MKTLDTGKIAEKYPLAKLTTTLTGAGYLAFEFSITAAMAIAFSTEALADMDESKFYSELDRAYFKLLKKFNR